MKKTHILLAMTFGIAAFAAAGAAAAAECSAAAGQTVLAITVKNVRSAKGDVTITVYPGNPKRFLAPHAKLVRIRPPAQAVVHACMTVPKAGDYAIAVYHDENGDHDFNRSFIGLPAEGYGFSNDAPALAGLPSYSAAKFTAHVGVNPLTITMRY
jgi:uncharacterized protein (DUF2141 family)